MWFLWPVFLFVHRKVVTVYRMNRAVQEKLVQHGETTRREFGRHLGYLSGMMVGGGGR